jgi:hypothetical protein
VKGLEWLKVCLSDRVYVDGDGSPSSLIIGNLLIR